ncbi:MAG: hypothetical protein V4654_13005 [Bdellovibrionota bacterium]
MSEAKTDIKPPTLFFVKNLNHQFAPVENFLKKRGYTVVIETDVKTALDRILAENPEYIFLAWDHKNENTRYMPKTIYQSCTGSVVPFIMSTQRDQIIQLESSGFENKLYPPLSGPAIIRVISKYEKKNQVFEQINSKKATNAKKESDMIKVKSFFTQDNDEGPEVNITKFNSMNDGERKTIANSSRKKLDMFAPQKRQKSQKAMSATQEGLRSKRMTPIVQEGVRELEDDDIDLASGSMSDLLSKESKSLSKGQIIFLDQSFNDTVKPEMFDVIENYSNLANDQLDLTTTTQIYVLVVQELEWTGYLTVASENYLDVASAQVILNNWIKQMIHIEQINQPDPDQDDLADSVLFEIRVPKVDYADLCSYKSEFYKDVEYEGKKTMLGFFSFSPFEVVNSIHQAFDMLELPTEFLQPNKELPFDVNLYLPENERFILYIRPGSFLDDIQVSRLQARKVKYIFSNMDYELALLKYKAEFNISKLIEIYNRIKASKT